MGTFGGKLGCGAAALIAALLGIPLLVMTAWVAGHGNGPSFLQLIAAKMVPVLGAAGFVGLGVRWIVNHFVPDEPGKSFSHLALGTAVALVLAGIAIVVGYGALIA